MIQQPSIGRIVHFVSNTGDHWPAVITRVWSATMVNVHVLPDLNPAFTFSSCKLDEHAAKPNTWHWPEPVKP